MAWPISKAGDKVIQLLKVHGIMLEPATDWQLGSKRNVNLFGYSCMVANVLSLSTFRIRVNMKWFVSHGSDESKPRLRTLEPKEAFDFQLIPTHKILYSIYYRALRDYALQLELDKNKWFNKPWWGIRVNEDEGTFVWEGGNTITFPLTIVCSQKSLLLREKQYLIHSFKRQETA
jgi:hypothetical protein